MNQHLGILQVLFSLAQGVKKAKSNTVETIEDVKEHKKLLRTRNNVLVIYAKSSKLLTVSQESHSCR